MARKPKTKEPAEEPKDDAPEADAEAEGAAETPPVTVPKRSLVGRIVPMLLVTLIAAAAGVGSGYLQAGMVESATIAKATAVPATKPTTPSVKYTGDLVLEEIDPIVTNLASPSDVWVRIETAMVFKNGTLDNPKVAAAEIRRDIVAYARTLSLSQLAGPSALQHLTEDLNDRVATRTAGRVTELIIETLVVQ